MLYFPDSTRTFFTLLKYLRDVHVFARCGTEVRSDQSYCSSAPACRGHQDSRSLKRGLPRRSRGTHPSRHAVAPWLRRAYRMTHSQTKAHTHTRTYMQNMQKGSCGRGMQRRRRRPGPPAWSGVMARCITNIHVGIFIIHRNCATSFERKPTEQEDEARANILLPLVAVLHLLQTGGALCTRGPLTPAESEGGDRGKSKVQ